eukprot:338234_1
MSPVFNYSTTPILETDSPTLQPSTSPTFEPTQNMTLSPTPYPTSNISSTTTLSPTIDNKTCARKKENNYYQDILYVIDTCIRYNKNDTFPYNLFIDNGSSSSSNS